MIPLEVLEGCEDFEGGDFRLMICQIFFRHFLDEVFEEVRGENVEQSFVERILRQSYELI